MFTYFERDCTLINIYFANFLEPTLRRCVRKITSYEKVYLVEFYWGKPTFLSKKFSIFGNYNISDNFLDEIREYCSPFLFKQDSFKNRKDLRKKATDRWTKKQHQQWVENQELQARYYWGCKQYENDNTSGDQMEAKVAFFVLGLSPFASTSEIKKAFRELAFRFHPDHQNRFCENINDYQNNFKYLQENYQKALYYANDYLLQNKVGVF